MSIKDMVKDGQKVTFQFYRQGELWYRTDNGFEFPVPTSDTGDGVFLAQDKAILFMRYIRKHLASIEEGRKENECFSSIVTKQADDGDGRVSALNTTWPDMHER